MLNKMKSRLISGKRLISIIAILALATTAFALESLPSETVGFVKVVADVGFTPFALPFTFYNAPHTQTMELDDIIGDQLTPGLAFNADKLWDMNYNITAYLNQVGNVWTGPLADSAFTLGHAYYIQNKHDSTDVYLAGEVDQSSVDYGLMAMGFTPVGVREAGTPHLDDVDLLSSGFTGGMAFDSDKIWDMSNNTTAWYNGVSWVGFTNLQPGHFYYIQVKNAPFTWIYDPGSKGTKVGSKLKIIKVNKPVNLR